MLERDITAAVLRHLRTLPDCFCWKEHGGQYGTAGIPDIICCYRGRFVALEVKQPGCKPTALQAATIAKIPGVPGETVVSLGWERRWRHSCRAVNCCVNWRSHSFTHDLLRKSPASRT